MINGEYENLTFKVIKLLENSFGQAVKNLAKKLGVNRNFLAGSLKALENQGCANSKRIGSAKVYFSNRGVTHVK
jgi:predicted transcriptional regulator